MSAQYSEHFHLLVHKYINGTASAEEISIVEDYYKLFSDLPDVLDMLSSEECELLENKIRERIAERIHKSKSGAVVPLFKAWQKIAAAIIIIGFSTIMFLLGPQQETPQVLTKTSQRGDIAPGTNHAILTLADGRQVILDNTSNNHLVAEESGITITTTSQGQLVYTASSSDRQASEQVVYNTIRTPSGGQYQVVLPDGSRVWLNAESVLKYPTRFTGGERNVELAGEAYFEVVTDKKKPFNVAVNNVKVEVLGTHFNIMAYANEGGINTTLIEGSVKVTRGVESMLIVPGQQVRVTDHMQVVNANINETIAWKEGYFLFESEDIKSIMRKISRWYSADVIYEGDVSGKYFGGKISRFRNVSEVLKMLELTGSIRFKIIPGDAKNERRIIVMP